MEYITEDGEVNGVLIDGERYSRTLVDTFTDSDGNKINVAFPVWLDREQKIVLIRDDSYEYWAVDSLCEFEQFVDTEAMTIAVSEIKSGVTV